MSYFFLLAFIFVVFWRPQEWLVPALFGWPILDAVVYLSILGFVLEWDNGRLKPDLKQPQYYLFFGLFLASLISHIANGYFAGLVNNWMTAFRICFFGILLFANMTTVARLRWIVRVFVLMACFMAVHCLLQQSRGFGFGGGRPVMSWRPGLDIMVPRSQFFGIFEDPNDTGQLMATAMPLSFIILRKKSIISFALGCAICYLLWIAIEGTWSRGSQIGIVAAAGIMILQWFPRKWLIPLLGICCLAVLPLLPHSGRFLEGSALERVDFWGQANWAFKHHPIFGVGLGMIREYIHRSRAVHNAFVTCYAELGVFGYFFWFTLLLTAIVGCARARIALKKGISPDGKWLYRFSGWGLAALGGFAASSYFLSRAFIFPLFFLMAMLGSVPFLAQNEFSEECVEPLDVPTQRESLIAGIPISLFSVAYIYVSVLLINMAR